MDYSIRAIKYNEIDYSLSSECTHLCSRVDQRVESVIVINALFSNIRLMVYDNFARC